MHSPTAALENPHPIPRRAWPHHLLVAALYLAGWLILIAPALPLFASHIFMDGTDGSQNFWNEWWVRRAVAELRLPWHTDMLFHPHGITMIGATLNPFNGFATVPLCWFLGPVAAFNAMIGFAFVTTGYATFLLAREWTGAWWPSVLAGALFTFCPWHTAHAQTHMQLVTLQGLPLFLWLWLRLLRQPTHGRAVLAGLGLLLVVLCDYYLTFYAVLSGGSMLAAHVLFGLRDGFARRAFRPLATFALISLLTSGPIVFDLLLTMDKDRLAGGHGDVPYRNDLLGLLVPGGGWRFAAWTERVWSRHPLGGDWVELAAHAGLSVLALAGYAAWRAGREGMRRTVLGWLLLGAVFYALSLGEQLLVAGRAFPDVPMPYAALVQLVPGLGNTGMPARMAVVTQLTLALLAGCGMAFAWRRRPRLRWLLLGFPLLWAFEVWPRPQNVYRPEPSSVIETLRTLPPGAVAGFDSLGGPALFYQTVFEKPVITGYVARRTAFHEEIRLNLDALRSAGRYRELMERGHATYLVRHRVALPPVRDPALKRIARDAKFELWTWAHSPLPALDPATPEPSEPAARVVATRSGAADLEVYSPGDPDCAFCLAFSRTRVPGVRMEDDKYLELATDPVFKLSMQRDNDQFKTNWGRLDGAGRARFTLDTTRMTKGLELVLWASLFVFEGGRTHRVRRLHRPVRIVLRP